MMAEGLGVAGLRWLTDQTDEALGVGPGRLGRQYGSASATGRSVERAGS
jgi:hypothetical protein